jgi:hypothetical protein
VLGTALVLAVRATTARPLSATCGGRVIPLTAVRGMRREPTAAGGAR